MISLTERNGRKELHQMEFSKTIKRLRAEKGWSQETLAEKAYVSRQTVSNWETEKSYPDIHSILILSDLFGVSLDELIKGDVEVMKDTVKKDDTNKLKRYELLALSQMLALIFGCTLLFEYGGEAGKVFGCLLMGILSVCIFMTFRASEQLRQDNDIQTYREYLAFINGETLDDIEKAKELKKRSTQRKLMIFASAQAAIILIIAAVIAILQII